MTKLKQNYYQKHIFICTNLKEKGKCCGANEIAKATVNELKSLTKEAGLNGENGIRISSSGCLGRCSEGPVAVLYPEGKWFYLLSEEDQNELRNLCQSM